MNIKLKVRKNSLRKDKSVWEKEALDRSRDHSATEQPQIHIANGNTIFDQSPANSAMCDRNQVVSIA